MPGIYRLTFDARRDQDRPMVYLGESGDLRKRASRYRRPGSGQQTNHRIHRELLDHLAGGATVTMAVATTAFIEAGGEEEPLNLAKKTARVLAGHAALALMYLAGEAVIIDQDKTTGHE